VYYHRVRAVAALITGWALAAALLPTSRAWAGVQDWQVSEVVTSVAGDPRIRYIELENPVGGCMYPSTRIEVYDASGEPLGQVAPVAATTCFGPDTFYLLATSDAVVFFGTTADHQIVPVIPRDAGQICFASSTTRYDCVRWGAIAQPVYDFYGAADATTAMAPPDGQGLSRIDTTHVVAADWSILSPTPRGPNNGTPWTPPDAGITPDAAVVDAGPDAGITPDAAGPADAALPVDARERADARNTRFLDLDPVGGATCGCRAGSSDGPARHLPLAALALLSLVALRRRGKSSPRSAGQAGRDPGREPRDH
jgi:MYXO-CTERM domain-containing protein